MNLGRALISLLIVISLSAGATCIYPHHLGFRLKPQSSQRTEESKPRSSQLGGLRFEAHATGIKTEESKSRPSRLGGSKFEAGTSKTEESGSRGANVVYCFASNCDVECTTKCISISSATGRPVSVNKPNLVSVGKEKKRSSAEVVGSFLELFTRGLLKKIPLRALVRLTITEEGRRGRQLGIMQKITRVQ